MDEPIVVVSPDKKRKAVLRQIGETKSGQRYYSLSVNGIETSFKGRAFGRVCLWSHDSRFLSVQEWIEIDETAGPKSYLLMILDMLTWRECVVADVVGSKSIIIPQGFIGESLMYTVIYGGQFGITKNFESRFQNLSGWRTLK